METTFEIKEASGGVVESLDNSLKHPTLMLDFKS